VCGASSALEGIAGGATGDVLGVVYCQRRRLHHALGTGPQAGLVEIYRNITVIPHCSYGIGAKLLQLV